MPKRAPDKAAIAKKYPWSDFVKRREVLEGTIQAFEQRGGAIREFAEANHARAKAKSMESKASSKEKRVAVVRGDWGSVAQELSMQDGEIYAVLNMANAQSPGGFYQEGAPAQEENMYRRTDCHFYIHEDDLDESNEFYNAEMQSLINGDSGRVFLDTNNPRLCIRGKETTDETSYCDLGEDNYFKFYELRSAATDLRVPGKQSEFYPFNEESMRRKIRAQLETLKEAGCRHVVLGAFGCGAFGNPPEEVAGIYKEELENFLDCFDNITFAIYYPGYGNDNFPPFQAALDGFPLTKEVFRAENETELSHSSDPTDTTKLALPLEDQAWLIPFIDKDTVKKLAIAFLVISIVAALIGTLGAAGVVPALAGAASAAFSASGASGLSGGLLYASCFFSKQKSKPPRGSESVSRKSESSTLEVTDDPDPDDPKTPSSDL